MSGLCLSALANVRVGGYTNTPPAWEFDVDAIEAAARSLRLRRPIIVACARYPTGRWQGMASYANGAHDLHVGCALTADQASRTLWHELTHAQQRERLGDRYWREYMAAGGRTGPGYHANRFEHEARANEPRATLEPLVRT